MTKIGKRLYVIEAEPVQPIVIPVPKKEPEKKPTPVEVPERERELVPA